jgi:hypothetical protein
MTINLLIITIIIGKTALFEPQPSLEDSARFIYWITPSGFHFFGFQILIFSVTGTTAKDHLSVHKIQAIYTKGCENEVKQLIRMKQNWWRKQKEHMKNTNVSSVHSVSQPLLMKLFCAFISNCHNLKIPRE